MRSLPILILTAALFGAPALAQTPSAAGEAAGVSDADKVRRSADSLKRMREVLSHVLGKVEEARNTRDVVKLNCVNEKLTQVKKLIRASEQADAALREGIAQGKKASADHGFTKVTTARGKVEQLRAEAEECIGQLAFQIDDKRIVEVEEPEGLPADPTQPAQPPALISRPPPASPFR